MIYIENHNVSTKRSSFLKKLDPVCRENNIPFSRLYGRNILLNAGSLVASLRNYTLPLFSGSNGKCEGCIVLAQQVMLKVLFASFFLLHFF